MKTVAAKFIDHEARLADPTGRELVASVKEGNGAWGSAQGGQKLGPRQSVRSAWNPPMWSLQH